MRKSFDKTSFTVVEPFKKKFVRCHLEFAVPAWSPWAVGDIEVLERVQRQAINMAAGLAGRTYEDKLTELGPTTLLERRAKLDMIQTHKIINGTYRQRTDRHLVQTSR